MFSLSLTSQLLQKWGCTPNTLVFLYLKCGLHLDFYWCISYLLPVESSVIYGPEVIPLALSVLYRQVLIYIKVTVTISIGILLICLIHPHVIYSLEPNQSQSSQHNSVCEQISAIEPKLFFLCIFSSNICNIFTSCLSAAVGPFAMFCVALKIKWPESSCIVMHISLILQQSRRVFLGTRFVFAK